MRALVFLILVGLLALWQTPPAQAQLTEKDHARFRELLKQLRDPDPQVRQKAAVTIGAFVSKLDSMSRELVHSLKDPSPFVRSQAAFSLMLCGPSARHAIPELIEALKQETDVGALGNMIGALVAMAPFSKNAIPLLLPHFEHEHPDIRSRVVCGVVKFGPAAKVAVPALLRALNDSNEGVRISATITLGKLGSVAQQAAPVFFEKLKSKDETERVRAMGALAKIVPNDKRLLPLYIKTLRENQSLKIRTSAAFCLLLLGPKAKKAVPELAKALFVYQGNPPRQPEILRSTALRALEAIGPDAKAAIPQIREMARSDPRSTLRLQAKQVLRKIEQPQDK